MPGNEELGLRGNAIGLPRIIFFVIAAAAPLTGTLGAIPIAIGFGNGAGVPAAFLAVGVLLALFSIGYTRMAMRIRNAGAFYAFIAAGLGSPAGLGAALVALLSYSALQIALYGLFGYFCTLLVGPLLHADLPWSVFAVAALAIAHMLGRRGVEVNGTILGLLMIAETSIVLLLVAAILVGGGGPEGFVFSAFHPARLFDAGSGIALVFALACFVGFEATAIYAEEARDPARTVPLATYCAVAVISLFFALVSWAIVCAYGPAQVQAAAKADPGAFWFAVSERKLGGAVTMLMSFLLLASTFASILAFHNMIARYLYALGRQGIFWARLGHTHAMHRSPHVAGAMQSLSALAILMPCVLTGADPYATVFGLGGATGTIGIIGLQAMLCLSVIRYFAGDRTQSRFATLFAPLLSAFGMGAILLLAVRNFDVLSGVNSPFVAALPWLHVMVFAIGMLLCMAARHVHPALYGRLTRLVADSRT